MELRLLITRMRNEGEILRKEMTHRLLLSKRIARTLWCLGPMVFCCSATVIAQDQAPAGTPNSGCVKRGTAILGLEGISSNATVDISIQNDALLFQPSEGATFRIPIGAIQDVFLSQQDKQVGGKALAIGKAATPYGGGRVIGLVAHKKYDFLTLEYLDSNGALH